MHHMIYIYRQEMAYYYIGFYKNEIKYINVAQILINIFSLNNVMFLCKESVLLEQLNIHLDRQYPRFCFKKFQGLSNLWSGRMRSQSHLDTLFTGPRLSSQPAMMSATLSSDRPRNSLGEKKSRSKTVRQRISCCKSFTRNCMLAFQWGLHPGEQVITFLPNWYNCIGSASLFLPTNYTFG